MATINDIRKIFPFSGNDEKKIVELIENILLKIDKKKHGTIIGRKKEVDYEKLLTDSSFPSQMLSEEEAMEKILSLYDGVSLWAHPLTQVNVVPPPTSASIAVATLAARFNENSIWDHYGMSASQSEVMAVGMLADLIGFDKKKAGGVFTFGGTGCNLYAARIGIEKADPDAKTTGLRNRIHFFCSDISHYSIKSSAIWTGIGLNNIKTISSNIENVIQVEELEKAMYETVNEGARIGTIFATMGTTDAFGIDPLKEISQLRDMVEKKVGYRIHLHADAVIGWPYLTFKGDEENIKQFPERLQNEILQVVSKMSELKFADSVGIDFHKTGWSPYLCSAIIVKNRDDLFMLEKFKKDMPYLYHGSGYQPGIFTLESSRPNYAQKALINILLFGREGYETIVAHLLSVSDYLRSCIEDTDEISLLNRHNPAFVTDFRIYPDSKFTSDGDPVFEKELNDETTIEFTDKINEYNRRIVDLMIKTAEQKGTSLLSYTDSYRTTRNRRMIIAVKSYPMSPFTDNEHMDLLLEDLYHAKKKIDDKI